MMSRMSRRDASLSRRVQSSSITTTSAVRFGTIYDWTMAPGSPGRPIDPRLAPATDILRSNMTQWARGRRSRKRMFAAIYELED